MKRAAVYVGGLFLCVVMWSVPCPAEEYRLGYVDIQRAVTESLAGKEAMEQFKQEADKLKDEILAEKQEVEKLGEALQKQGMMLADEVRREKEKEFLKRKRDYERMVKDSETELQIKEAELTNDILDKLLPIVQQYGKDNNYSIIFEKSVRILLYASDGLDLTDRVLKLFDAEFAKKNR